MQAVAMANSGISMVTAIVTAIIVFLFTTAWITAKAALNTLRKAKSAVPDARKTYRSTVGGVVKMGLLLAILVFALVAWAASEVQSADDEKPAPGPSASHP
jgi:UDP-N-acetylmuramyl pentapeptide phosphotransferase/UDP-N-acetylglucosamine-1-phosphate transferase